MFKEIIPRLKKIYQEGGNILQFIKEEMESNNNPTFGIEISYDLQAGSYIKKAKENIEYENKRAQQFADIINNLDSCKTLLEVGTGEATTLGNIVPRLNCKNVIAGGFDLSYSRIQFAKKHLSDIGIDNSNLLVGDIFHSPFEDNSIDMVISNHSLEPNGGKEIELLEELYRISNKYIVLFEPMYEFANDDQKAHMEKHGYIKNLYHSAKKLEYNILDYKLLYNKTRSVLNNTGLLIIEKKSNFNELEYGNIFPLACPISRKPLIYVNDSFYCRESMLVYPVINNIPCLRPENAVIASHFIDL